MHPNSLARAWSAIDWDLRVRVPAFIRAAGLLEYAKKLEKSPEVHDVTTLLALRDTAANAARAAYCLWLKRKAPVDTTGCRAAKAAAVEATGRTILPSARASVEAIHEVQAESTGWAVMVCGDAENAASWAAAVVATGDGSWAEARERLLPIVREIEATPWQ